MPDSVFECGNEKCGNSIAATGLNKIQLEVLRRWAKTCPKCKQLTKWQEKLPLLNTEKIKHNSGGSQYGAHQEPIKKGRYRNRRP